MKALSMDLRERVVALYHEVKVMAQVARRLRVSESSVRRYVRAAAGRSLAPVRPKGRARARAADRHDLLVAQVKTYPDDALQ